MKEIAARCIHMEKLGNGQDVCVGFKIECGMVKETMSECHCTCKRYAYMHGGVVEHPERRAYKRKSKLVFGKTEPKLTSVPQCFSRIND